MGILSNLTTNGSLFFNFYTQQFIPWIDKGVSAFIVLVVGFIIILVLTKILKLFEKKVNKYQTVKKFIFKLIETVLWIILFVVVLTTAGVQVGPILAGLGIAGFIVGFALKDTLSNFASGFMIIAYRPFKIGEHVEVAGVKAIVKTVGGSACTFVDEENNLIIIPNSKIWGGVIKNFDRLKKK